MYKKIFSVFAMFLIFNTLALTQPECFSAFKTGKFRKGDTVEAYYFMTAVYNSPDGKGKITYISPILQINAKKTDTTWSRNGIGLFRYGILEFKDSIKALNPELGVTYAGDYKGMVSQGFNPSRRIHINAFCLNELRKFYYKEANKGKDQAIYLNDFEFVLTEHKDRDFDTLVIQKFKGDLSKPAMVKEFMKMKKEEK